MIEEFEAIGIASILGGITTLLSQPSLDEGECMVLSKQIHPIAQELDRFMIELNQLYEQKDKSIH